MNLPTPKISVIVPVYNVENYVSKCIESIINQTYKNLEIIIVNDGSTDKSGDICEYYAKVDDRLIIIHQENQELSMARNNALDIATGEYIGFVDSDDWIAPDMYSTLYSNADEYGADISMCNFYYVDENGGKSPYSGESGETKVLGGIHKIAHNIRLSNNCVWNRLYKRHLFDDIRFPKGKVFEDIFVMHKLVDKANKVVLSPLCKYYYLLRGGGITLSPFNLRQMDQVEAYIGRHEYISAKYPNLEKTSRKYIFSSLLWGMRRAYIHGSIEANREPLQKIIDKVRDYDFLDCGLLPGEINLLTMLFGGISSYVEGMGLFARRNQSREIKENEETTQENSEEINWLSENRHLIADPAVSVVIPVYNVEPYLRQCLDSVISQTLANIEIICINDGSPDNSLEILREYEKKDSRIIVISRENKGVAASRNEAILTAKGEFVAFMDSDDWYPSDRTLMELYAYAKKYGASICGGSLSQYIGGKIMCGAPGTEFEKKGFVEYKDFQYSYYFQRFIFDREMLVNNNIFFPPYIHYEDPPFLVRAMITASKFYAVKSVVYRHRESYKSVNFTENAIADIFSGLKDCLVLSGEHNLPKLHIFSANSLFDRYYPFSPSLQSDTGRLHKLLFEFLLAVDYTIMNKDFITRVLNFFGRGNETYSKHTPKNKTDFFSVFAGYKEMLSERGIYTSVQDDFIALYNELMKE